jgi:hypothetical protein
MPCLAAAAYDFKCIFLRTLRQFLCFQPGAVASVFDGITGSYRISKKLLRLTFNLQRRPIRGRNEVQEISCAICAKHLI